MPGYICSVSAPGTVALQTKFLDGSLGEMHYVAYEGFFHVQKASSSFTTLTYGRKSLVNNEARLLKCT